jgi:hypothetical protein
MGAKAEALAKQFEAKTQEATAVLEKMSEADWKKVTEAEKWTVGVTAHHVAGAHEPIAMIVKTVAAGQSMPHFTMDMLHEANAKRTRSRSTGRAPPRRPPSCGGSRTISSRRAAPSWPACRP